MLSGILLLTTAAAAAQPTWLVGSGLHYSAPATSALGNLTCLGGGCGALYSADPGLGLGVTVERRLADRMWLMFLATAAYRKETLTGTPYGYTSRAATASAFAGPRYVLTTDLPVEVALYGVAGGWYASAETTGSAGSSALSESSDTSSTSHGAGFALRGGLTFDRTLVDGLGVRLGLGVLGLDWSTSEVETSGAEADRVGFGLRPEASLLLTMAF